ncbi:hypothetical protein MGH68_10575 [Erysipelothrix sp. D19-032]
MQRNDIDALVNTLETFSFDAYSVDQCVARAQEFAKETMIKNYMKMLINEETTEWVNLSFLHLCECSHIRMFLIKV